jgi:serine/threonine-protein kinase
VSEEKFKLTRFGRYLLLDHLVDGGMAQIFRARFLGEQADKIVAIKMIRQQFSADENFKKMFMDEIKVTFDLIHPNIVQTYDYGEKDDSLYVAMEYVDGRNLQEYLKELRKNKFVFPIDITVYITTQICRALHYSHTKIDKLTGKEANIIHRDISPHNVMLGYDGTVKVIDFGIAKAETNSDSTRAGTIKGKLSYLAPEYLEGMELDPRYDEFATGITLWEMLCNRKLFKAENDLAVLRLIQTCEIPVPSSINPKIPPELDEIVMKCLSKDREKRYKNLDQMDRALTKFLFQSFPEFNPSDLGYFAQQLFKNDIEESNKKLFEFGKVDITPYLEELKNEKTGSQGEEEEIAEEKIEERIGIKKEQVLDFGFEEKKEKKFSFKDLKKSQTRSGQLIKGDDGEMAFKDEADKTANLTAGGLKIEEQTPKATGGLAKKEQMRQKREEKARQLEEAIQDGSDEEIKEEGGSKKKIILVASILLAALYFGYDKNKDVIDKMVGDISGEKVAETNREISSKPTPKRVHQKGYLILDNYDPISNRVFLDGVPAKLDVFGETRIPVGKEIVLRVEVKGRENFVKKIMLPSAEKKVRLKIPVLPYAKYSYLRTGNDCAKGTIEYKLFGENRVENIPIKKRKGLPFPMKLSPEGTAIGTSHAVLFKSSGRSVKRSLTLNFAAEDDVLDFCQVLFDE